MGLTTDDLAVALDVREDTIRKWESGTPIPHAIRAEVAALERFTTARVDELIAALRASSTPTVTVSGPLDPTEPAWTRERWWRHVVARARQELPEVRIETDGD